jgi:hypothetical protein
MSEVRVVAVHESPAEADCADGATVPDACAAMALHLRRAARCDVAGLPVAGAAFASMPVAFGSLKPVSEAALVAESKRYRRLKSRGKESLLVLLGTLTVFISVAAVMLARAWLFPAPEPSALQRKLLIYQAEEPPTAVRLSQKFKARYRKRVEQIRRDAEYDSLSATDRAFVKDRLGEFADYDDYLARFEPPVVAPNDVRTLGELAATEAAIDRDLLRFAGRTEAWGGTEAVQLWMKWHTDLNLLRQWESRLHDYYRARTRRGVELAYPAMPDATWQASVSAFLQELSPCPTSGVVRDSVKLSITHGESLQWTAVWQQARVVKALSDWRRVERRLRYDLIWHDAMIKFGEWIGRRLRAPLSPLEGRGAGGEGRLRADLNDFEMVAFPGRRGFLHAFRKTLLAEANDDARHGDRVVSGRILHDFFHHHAARDMVQGDAVSLLQQAETSPFPS